MNSITEGKDRELPPNGDGEILRAKTPAELDLKDEVKEASKFKEAGDGEAMRARSSIESRTDLRLAATNEAMRADPSRTAPTLAIDTETARRWADLDASDFGRIRSDSRRENALDAIAGNIRVSPEYSDELRKRSPNLAEAAKVLAEEKARTEQAARIDASQRSREALIDAASLAAVAALRSEQTARVVEQLAKAPETTTHELRDAALALKNPQKTPLEPFLPGAQAQASDVGENYTRPVKRPISEHELSQALLTRYVVTHEKQGRFDPGATDFTFRSGERQGSLAFSDAGKSITTSLEDKSTIRAMVEVAVAKKWKEITVSGSDDFRRNAWLEASINGLSVRGFEPREADKKLLEELRTRPEPSNDLSLDDRERQRQAGAVKPVGQPFEPQRKHINTDELSPHEKSVLAHSRSILDSKALGEQFSQAALEELEAKLRGERVYVGEVIEHGAAPYQFDKDKDQSYYVVLKTRAGEQVVWGKGLADALDGRKPGDQIVLQNSGKTPVTVTERVHGENGQLLGTRAKQSTFNQWKSDLLSQVSEKAKRDFESRAVPKKPAFGVYDPRAARPTPTPIDRSQMLSPEQRHERKSRDR